MLEKPGRNYALLAAIDPRRGAPDTDTRSSGASFALELVSVGLALVLLQALYAVFDRQRPSEVFDRAEIALAYGHNWAAIESFPSGHMAVVTALAASAWFAIPQLRGILVAYIALNAVTRVAFGAHFPVDVVAGAALGYGSALAGRSLFAQTAAMRERPSNRRRSASTRDRVRAVMPSHGDVPDRALVAELLDNVGGLTIVDDGSDRDTALELDRIAGEFGAELVRLPERRGKGAALREGVAAALAHDSPPDAVLLIDADGQHPPDAIPSLLEAASTAELVIGDRFGDLGEMPLKRRLANQASRMLLELTTGRRVRDTQSGPAAPPRPRACSADPGRRLRGGEPPPESAARPRRRRRLGAYPGDLRRRAKRIPLDPGLRPRCRGSGRSRWKRRDRQDRSPRPGGFRPERPTRSEPRDTRATGQPCLQGPGGGP